jgi:hypothetical protein
VRATPTTPNSAGIRLCRARFSTAGPSLRAVRSPDAPKITTAAGGALRSSITVCPAAAWAAVISPVGIRDHPFLSGHEAEALRSCPGQLSNSAVPSRLSEHYSDRNRTRHRAARRPCYSLGLAYSFSLLSLRRLPHRFDRDEDSPLGVHSTIGVGAECENQLCGHVGAVSMKGASESGFWSESPLVAGAGRHRRRRLSRRDRHAGRPGCGGRPPSGLVAEHTRLLVCRVRWDVATGAVSADPRSRRRRTLAFGECIAPCSTAPGGTG